MGDLSANFSKKEFACKCGCGMITMHPGIIPILQDLRDHFGRIQIVSGNRCRVHNTRVGGAPRSYHMLSMAADCKFLDLEETLPKAAYEYACITYEGKCGFILYPTFLHVDIRIHPYRKIQI